MKTIIILLLSGFIFNLNPVEYKRDRVLEYTMSRYMNYSLDRLILEGYR